MSSNKFLESWSHELTSRASRVRALIGSVHWPSDGFHKEHLVREALTRIVRPPLHVSSGFIRSANGQVSPEIDVLIYSSTRGFPYFTEGDLTILPPKLALGALEVKSKWTARALKDILSKSVSTWEAARSACDEDIQLWTGATFFQANSSRDLRSLLNTLENRLKAAWKENRSESIDLFISSLPKSISVVDRAVIFLKPSVASAAVKLTAFKSEELSFAVQLIDLLGHMHSVVNSSTEPLDFENELNLTTQFKFLQSEVRL